jgi:hypothetical protein
MKSTVRLSQEKRTSNVDTDFSLKRQCSNLQSPRFIDTVALSKFHKHAWVRELLSIAGTPPSAELHQHSTLAEPHLKLRPQRKLSLLSHDMLVLMISVECLHRYLA